MEVTLTVASLVVLFGVASAATLSAVLWIGPSGENRIVNRYLSLLLLNHCLIVSGSFIFSNDLTDNQLVLSLSSFQMCVGPLMYFYARSITQNAATWTKGDLLHLLPAVLMAMIWILQVSSPWFSWLTPSCLAAQIECNQIYQARFTHRFTAWISLVLYASWSLSIIASHQQRIRLFYSEIGNISLKWLYLMNYAVLFFTSIAICFEVFYYAGVASTALGSLIHSFAPFVLSLSMSWFGLQQSSIQDDVRSAEPKGLPHKTSRTDHENFGNKYQTSSLTEQEAEEIWLKLQETMEIDKPYLENGLKISTLAELLNISVNHLSETINGYARQNFYDFVNKHRVDEAMLLLTDESQNHSSIAEIGYQSGFNSNSTFFTHFKKHTLQTPKDFRANAQKKI